MGDFMNDYYLVKVRMLISGVVIREELVVRGQRLDMVGKLRDLYSWLDCEVKLPIHRLESFESERNAIPVWEVKE